MGCAGLGGLKRARVFPIESTQGVLCPRWLLVDEVATPAAKAMPALFGLMKMLRGIGFAVARLGGV